jgi:hypothetical protein
MELKQLPQDSATRPQDLNEKPRLLSYVAYSKPYTLDYSRVGLQPTGSLWGMTSSDPSKTLIQRDP